MSHLLTRTAAVAAAAGTALLGFTGIASAAAPPSPSGTVLCSSASASVARGGTAVIALDCAATDDSPITSYELVSGPTKAATFTFDASTGRITYVAAATAGTDTFSFRAHSGAAGSSAVTTGTVQVENAAPVCAAVPTSTVIHDRVLTIATNCTDVDGDALTYQLGANAAANGVVTFVGGKVVYTPKARFVGSDDFSIVARDGAASSVERLVSVTVTNRAASCASATITVSHGRAVRVPAVCTDLDGDKLALKVVAKPQRGSVNSGWVYVAKAKFVGNDTLTYSATDGVSTSNVARVNVRVVNSAPTCVDSRARIGVRGAYSWVVRCSDADQDALKVQVINAPDRGRISVKGTRLTYVPSERSFGNDFVVLRVTDTLGRTDTQTVYFRTYPSRPVITGVKLSPSALAFKVACAHTARDCNGTVTVAVGSGKGKAFTTSARFSVDNDRTATITVTLAKAQRAVAGKYKAGTKVTSIMTVTANDSGGARSTYKVAPVFPKTAR